MEELPVRHRFREVGRMRNLLGRLAWRVMKWSWSIVTKDKDVIFVHVAIPPGFYCDAIEDMVIEDFRAKAVRLVREGVQLPVPQLADRRSANPGGYF